MRMSGWTGNLGSRCIEHLNSCPELPAGQFESGTGAAYVNWFAPAAGLGGQG